VILSASLTFARKIARGWMELAIDYVLNGAWRTDFTEKFRNDFRVLGLVRANQE